jgi:hypothetical protein
LATEADEILLGSEDWYARAKRALHSKGALLLVIRPPTAGRMRGHLTKLSRREGGFWQIFYMLLTIRFHALFFRATARMSLGVVMRSREELLEVCMHGEVAEDKLRSGETMIIAAAQYRDGD